MSNKVNVQLLEDQYQDMLDNREYTDFKIGDRIVDIGDGIAGGLGCDAFGIITEPHYYTTGDFDGWWVEWEDGSTAWTWHNYIMLESEYFDKLSYYVSETKKDDEIIYSKESNMTFEDSHITMKVPREVFDSLIPSILQESIDTLKKDQENVISRGNGYVFSSDMLTDIIKIEKLIDALEAVKKYYS